ncbi:7782_t:CDS:2 [Entrophospora sp. SA101]|nr:7782_t:CDS:2 [Entrophospora sp. SA101]
MIREKKLRTQEVLLTSQDTPPLFPMSRIITNQNLGTNLKKTLPEAEGSISSSDKKANVSKPPSSRPPINTTLPDDPEEK